ncbi:hypothetical protein ACFWVC_14130 [Streptomyces sp. NPDC058691]|uniref:hypothetical protein n=1 Tax=Streptomyces sp. NPDC058691 TaxID=3346601 RepID=UPI0036538600
MGEGENPRPLHHGPEPRIPQTAGPAWTCRQCAAPWPCAEALPHLTESRCGCGSPSYWEQRGPSNYLHTPTGPGDVRPGTWLWIRPGGLHPGWGDIHHLAMLTAVDAPKCPL